METEKINLKILLSSIIGVLILEYLFRLLLGFLPVSQLIAVGLVRLIETGILILVLIYFGRGPASISLKQEHITEGIKQGVKWSGAFGILVLICFAILFLLGKNPLTMISAPIPDRIRELCLYFLTGCIISPFAEEILFRGIVFRFFRRFGVITAISISTLLFTAAHLRLGLPQIIGGILFAIAYEKEDNLTVPFTIHLLGNSAIFVLTIFQTRLN